MQVGYHYGQRRRSAQAAGLASMAGRLVRRYAPVARDYIMRGYNRYRINNMIRQMRNGAAVQSMRDRAAAQRAGQSLHNATFSRGGVQGNDQGYATTLKKSKRKRKAVSAFSKRQKKSIKRIAKAVDWEKLNKWQRTTLGQSVSAVNKVHYTTFLNRTHGSWTDFLTNPQITTAVSGVTTLNIQHPEDLVGTTGAHKLYKLKMKYKMLLRNNTNAPVDLVVYFLKGKEVTTVTVAEDHDNRLEREYATGTLSPAAPTAAPAKEDMFMQYWSTSNMKDAHYGLVKRTVMRLNSGDEKTLVFAYTFNLDLNPYDGVPTNMFKNFPVIYMRQQGVVTHGSTVTDNGISNTQIDWLTHEEYEVYVKTDAVSTSTKQVIANVGFDAVSPIMAAEDNVGVYDAA